MDFTINKQAKSLGGENFCHVNQSKPETAFDFLLTISAGYKLLSLYFVLFNRRIIMSIGRIS